MNWKEFIKPNLLKLILFVALFVIFTFVPSGLQIVSDVGSVSCIDFVDKPGFCGNYNIIGLPLPYLWLINASGLPLPYLRLGEYEYFYIDTPFFVVNLIFWYLVSAVLVWFYEKIKKK
jgi:hypothetical protein